MYFYPNPLYNIYPVYRQYPPIDETIFSHSVTAFQKIANEASLVLKRFADPQFSRRLMTAAQKGNQMEVDRLIKSIGTSAPITTKYTPSGVLLTIHAQPLGEDCCTLTMYLKWGR